MSGGYYSDDYGYGGIPINRWQAAMQSRNQQFSEYFRCYPVVMMPGKERDELNYGGKIILPPSALNKLTRLSISYPMLFELTNEALELVTHAGVLEFIAEEGRVYLPQWMMERLELQPGSLVKIASSSLPQGSFVKIEPQSPNFLDISDPKAVLENALRNFTTLTVDDIFAIKYNNKVYHIKVLEIKPTSKTGISVVETDLEVDFAPPVGYVEPTRRAMSTTPQSSLGSSSVMPTPDGRSMASEIGYARLVSASQSAVSLLRSQTSSPVPSAQSTGHRLSGRPIHTAASSSRGSTPAAAPPTQGLVVPSLADAIRKGSEFAVTRNGQEDDRAIPAPLRLPFGQLFFGYPVVPVKQT
ncbi:ubiquitin fusion degradation protein UFD1-domain-containing protein [Limtongia smithiae]|uniref:ubiquitin fusion degradation protein UFD1-domain-containing protein n=1 Tax=Limtongia smithiae TaxID=1125753 RepID=UPI0034CE2E9F